MKLDYMCQEVRERMNSYLGLALFPGYLNTDGFS